MGEVKSVLSELGARRDGSELAFKYIENAMESERVA
jgi:hypothetical protein